MYMYITTIQLSTFPTYDRFFLLHNTCNKPLHKCVRTTSFILSRNLKNKVVEKFCQIYLLPSPLAETCQLTYRVVLEQLRPQPLDFLSKHVERCLAKYTKKKVHRRSLP